MPGSMALPDEALNILATRELKASTDAAQGKSREELETVIGRTPFAAWLGAKVLKYGSGHVTLSVPMHRDITMHHGFVHGAIVGFVADSACAWAAASVVGDVVTSEYKLSLLAPAVGESLLGVGSVIKVSGRQIACRADVFSMQGDRQQMVATALATITKFTTRRTPDDHL